MYIFLPQYLKSLDISKFVFFLVPQSMRGQGLTVVVKYTQFNVLSIYIAGPQNYTDVIEAFMNLLSQVSHNCYWYFYIKNQISRYKKSRYVSSTCFSPNYNIVFLVFPIEGSEEKQSHPDHRAVCSTDEKSLPLRYQI